ncbi:MAG: hypothetical protein ACOX2K_01485 [Bacillota bacterium]
MAAVDMGTVLLSGTPDSRTVPMSGRFFVMLQAGKYVSIGEFA